MHLIPNKFDETIAFVVCEKGDSIMIDNSECTVQVWPDSNDVQIFDLPPGDWEICFKHSEVDKTDSMCIWDAAAGAVHSGISYENKTNRQVMESIYYHHSIDLTKEVIVIKRK